MGLNTDDAVHEEASALQMLEAIRDLQESIDSLAASIDSMNEKISGLDFEIDGMSASMAAGLDSLTRAVEG